ncbi:PREDICTED: sorting nexin-16-like isoform X3 [Branchiostoma belcheri]|uniref:Sorting nexin-16-like isoform X3 n=1 Tax=Branchiostoma belcheri TaxID=7741 RepID=A0A6P5AEZ3_BRABE|nr:PREDICTED: sorting nexin-16-like isoform X3 [Branchiostoma belcheri]
MQPAGMRRQDNPHRTVEGRRTSDSPSRSSPLPTSPYPPTADSSEVETDDPNNGDSEVEPEVAVDAVSIVESEGTDRTPSPSDVEGLPPTAASSMLDCSETSSQHEFSYHTHQIQTSPLSEEFEGLRVPIVGYEIMEQRARYTLFKIHVQVEADEGWFVFRRYSDFQRLNEKLKARFPGYRFGLCDDEENNDGVMGKLRNLFPTFRLALPPKRWFKDNFDPNFLEDRILGLQAFVNNVIGHVDIVDSDPVREFFCLDDPPDPLDRLEESRGRNFTTSGNFSHSVEIQVAPLQALCESLEECVYNLRREVLEKNHEVEALKAELARSKARQEELERRLGLGGQSHSPAQGSEGSLAEADFPSAIEADQGQIHDQTANNTSSVTLSSLQSSENRMVSRSGLLTSADPSADTTADSWNTSDSSPAQNLPKFHSTPVISPAHLKKDAAAIRIQVQSASPPLQRAQVK